MVSYTRVTLLIFFLVPAALRAQTERPVAFEKNFLRDASSYIGGPTRWEEKDWLAFAGSTVITSTLFYFDEEINKELFAIRDASTGRLISRIVEPFGDGTFSLPVLAAIGTYGLLTHKQEHLQVAGAGLESFLFSAGAATGFKWIFQRQRPTPDAPLANGFVFEGPLGHMGDDGSFVSRHAATAFAVATVLASSYGKKRKWVGWLSYGLAGAVTLSRVYNGKHWASDAFAGAALGLATGKLVVRLHRDRGDALFQP